ncbi:hypothetical protein GIB67_013514 [Kingdonia uniflora]|uniref:C2H2-type domain-containing protein n=1 Tax=Kingdonia uniflora TaxID=39325 RepID=A0A7J7KUV9_9MAGN|nr:hypothetical protein GIB67_013514 [Kingdonia uniflora]
MAADLGLLPPSDHQITLPQPPPQQQQQQQNPSYTGQWMWNTTRPQEEDDSWEVRAFAEDTSNAMGTTWPPRSYTCTFCRREFRSAQALGGHMNVHRRDRARLRQSPPKTIITDLTLSPTSSSTLIFPTQEFVANGGICLLYPLPNPNGVFNSTSIPSSMDSPPTLLSISPYSMNNLISSYQPTSFPMEISSEKIEPALMFIDKESETNKNNDDNTGFEEELDLELRLGSKPEI